MPSQNAVIGLDIGTSSIKAVALTRSGEVTGPVRVATPTTLHPDGRAEHDPAALWAAVTDCLAALSGAGAPGTTFKALCTTTVGEAMVGVDDAGKETGPIIAWHDTRGRPYVRGWLDDPGAEALYLATGQTVDERASVNKILWMREHEPAAARRSALWLGMGAWANLRLCGVAATDPSLAGRTMLLDRCTRHWAPSLLRAAELPPSALPDVVPAGTAIGGLSGETALLTGLPAGLPVVVGGHDHLCASLIARSGTGALVNSVGSAESLVATVPEPPDARGWEAHVNCYPHAEPGQYAFSAQVGLTATILDWLAREMYQSEPGPETSRMMLAGMTTPLRPTGVMCFPEFGRGTSPNWDAAGALGAILGLTPSHTRSDIVQSVLEASAFSVRHSLEWMADHGVDTSEIRIEGGSATLPLWAQLKADVLGRTVETVETSEPTATGAAAFASVGAGWHPDAATAAAAIPVSTRRWEPSAEGAAAYDTLYREVFLRMADGLVPINRRIQRGQES
ncbi:hypothetical protein HQ535_12015 [bacterium]|nr:hypothetical protein [bacterium]